jgi:hypothetical protein
MCYGADWDIALTGVEATTLRHTLWSIVYGDGYDAPANTWGALNPQQQAESNSSVAFSAPAIVYCDGYHVNYVEADTFTGGSTRVYRTTLHLFTTYAYGANTMSAPAPVNYGGAEGLALAADAGGGGYLYETAPDIVTRAPLAQSLLTLTNDVLAVAIDERGDATSGYIELDNAGGAYAGPPAPIAVGNLVNLSWGYRTGAGPQAARMADLYIAACEYRRTGGVSTLRLHVEGGWELLRRNRQRTQVAHAGAETYLQILSRILSRAGLLLSTSGVSTRASTVTPKFTIHPRTSGYEAAQQALSFLAGPRQAGAVRRRADGAAGVRREHVLVRWSARAPRGAARAGAAAREQRAGLRRGSLRRGDRLRERGGRAGHATAGARLEQQHGRGRGGDGYGAAAPAGARHTRRRARRAAELRAGSARPDRLHRHIDLNFGGETARDGHRLAVRQAARDVRTDASPGGGMTIRSTILPGVLKAWYSGSWTADVQLTGSLQLWLAGVPVARNIASVEMVTGRNIAVVIFDETNPNDAAVIAVWT